jgi:hypothetical protein
MHNNMSFFSLCHTSIHMTESLPSLLDFEKMLLDRIEDLRGRIYKAHNPIYNETVMIETETLQWVYLK